MQYEEKYTPVPVPIKRPAETYDEVEKLFDPLSYNKGAVL